MAAVTFSYRSKKIESYLEVRLSFRIPGQNLSSSGKEMPYSFYGRSKILVDKNYWDNTHNLKTFPNYRDIEKQNEVQIIKEKQANINAQMHELKRFILNQFDRLNDHSLLEHIQNDWLSKVVELYYNQGVSKSELIPDTLISLIDYYLSNQDHLKYGTQKKFTTLKNKITDRVNDLGFNTDVPLSVLNDEFRRKYQTVFQDYSKNTIQQDLKLIKTICRYAIEKGVEISKDVLNWKIKFDSIPIIYLNEHEIKAITELKNLPDYLDNVRDWLLISIYTGQRISDFMRFDKSMIRREKNNKNKLVSLIEFTQVKTGTTLAIPLHKEVLKVLNKRKGEFPHAISEQKYNEYVKLVAQEAKLYDVVQGYKSTMIKDIGKRSEYGSFQKWELVSSHIGRRSFATNNYGKIPTPLLMSATGHGSESMFLKYIGKSQTDRAKQLADYF